MIFLDTNILYHILHNTPKTDYVLNLLEENPEDYVIDMVVHNEIIYTSTLHYLEHKYDVRGIYSMKRWIEKHGYPEEPINAIRELIRRLNIKLVPTIYIEQELYETILSYRLLPSDAIIVLTCKHNGIEAILTLDEDFKKVPWLRVIS